MSDPAEAVLCACGQRLLDGIDDAYVILGEERVRFRRTSDFVACERCGALYAVAELEPGTNRPAPGNEGPAPEGDLRDELLRLAEELGGASETTS